MNAAQKNVVPQLPPTCVSSFLIFFSSSPHTQRSATITTKMLYHPAPHTPAPWCMNSYCRTYFVTRWPSAHTSLASARTKRITIHLIRWLPLVQNLLLFFFFAYTYSQLAIRYKLQSSSSSSKRHGAAAVGKDIENCISMPRILLFLNFFSRRIFLHFSYVLDASKQFFLLCTCILLNGKSCSFCYYFRYMCMPTKFSTKWTWREYEYDDDVEVVLEIAFIALICGLSCIKFFAFSFFCVCCKRKQFLFDSWDVYLNYRHTRETGKCIFVAIIVDDANCD